MTSARAVILAVPSYNAAEIVKPLSRRLSDRLSEIPYAPISVVCFGYDESAIGRDLNGFGFLVPQRENRKILGSIWTSSIFSQRAPEGKIQLRTMVGGDGDHESIHLSDDQLISLVRNDLDQILQIKGTPEFIKIYRWQRGIPQYVVGHSLLMSQIENELKNLGNIFIAGNAYYGISLNDCVKQAHRVVESF